MSSGSMREVLQYVKNTNGGATKEDFISDHEPIGNYLWVTYHWEKSLITIGSDERIYLTQAGIDALKQEGEKK